MSNDRGSVTTEMCMVAFFLFAMIIVTIDFSLFIYRMHVGLHISNEIARRAAVGDIAGNNGLERGANVVTAVRNMAADFSFIIDANPGTVTVCPVTPANPGANCGVPNTGDRNGYFSLRIRQNTQSIVGIDIPVVAGALVRNEPFRF